VRDDRSVDRDDVAEARRVLRDLIAKVETSELDASPLVLARLAGALDALEAIGEPGPQNQESG
jgi:hypothetical protein